MSLHKFAEQVASQGRGDDSLLVHMTPEEVRNLQKFAQANGTTLTINPTTGLPEAGLLSDLFKAVAPIALGAFLGPGAFGIAGLGMSAGMAGAAVGGLTTLATGSLSRGLMAGLGAYGGAGLAEGLMGAGAGAAQQSAMGALTQDQIATEMAQGAFSFDGSGLTQQGVLNQAAADATKNALANTGQAVSSGFNVVTDNPSAMGSFAKDNFKYLAAAASPIMADMMVPTTTKQPDIAGNDTINQFIYGPTGYRRLNPVPAANYGTPAHKGFAGGGIVALNNGGVLHYDAGGATKDLTNLYAAFGGKEGYEKVQADYLKINNNPADFATAMAQFDKPSAFTPAPAAVVTPAAAAVTPAVVAPAVGAGAGKDLTNIYAQLGGKEAYDKIAADYLKATNNNEAGLASLMAQYDKPRPAYDAAAPASKTAMDNYIGGYTKDLTTKFKTPAEQALELMYRGTTGGTPTAVLDALGGYGAVKKLAESAGFDATPEWQQAYEKKMGYTVIPRMSTAETQAMEKRLQLEQAAKDKAAQDKINADAATAANKVTSGGVVDLLTDTSVKTDKTDTTTTGKNTLATTTASGVTSPKTTTDGTYTGTSGTAPTLNTLFGQGKFVGTGTEAGTGTTGPIMDFGGTSPFGLTSPLKLAQTQIAEESAAKNLADKNKLDLYSQWGTLNPKATNLEHANFVDKIGLDPAVAARLIGISPEQAQNAYNDAKYNKMTGDSEAAYRYLMGQGAYPTKSKVGEIARPYSEATLGLPANTNRQYIYDQTTGKYNRNPDYVAEYKDPSGGVNYLMSPTEIFNYFKKNASQDDATTYAWAIANNLTPKEISEATGVPLSQITPKWRAAASKSAADKAATEVKNEDGTINKEATDQKIAEKAAADKAAADVAADKAVKDNWDEAAYLAANPDVAAELASGKSVSGKPVKFTSGYEHYTAFGKAEGRKATAKAAGGGLMGYAVGGMPMANYAVGGGLGSLGSYSDGGRLLKGPGDGVSDSIPATIGQKQQPARLADGEFVIPARIVSELGNGSTDAGAKKLYAMMDRVQRARGKTTGKNKVAANSRADKYLPA